MPQAYLDKKNVNRPTDDILPIEIFTKELTIDSLKKARES